MKYSTKLLIASCIPVMVFAVIALTIGFVQFRDSLYDEKQGNLKSTALAALATAITAENPTDMFGAE